MKYKIGDELEIVNSFHGHEYSIGETVIVKNVDHGVEDYLVSNISGEKWYVREDEVVWYD